MVPSVISPGHKIPCAKVDKLKVCLEEMHIAGVIAGVGRPTEWASNLVIAEKRNGDLCLCLDPKPLNLAIKQEHFEIPTPEEVQVKLGKNCVFRIRHVQCLLAYKAV